MAKKANVEMRRVRLSFPEDDPVTNAWIDAQPSASSSIRTLIREAMMAHGAIDALSRPLPAAPAKPSAEQVWEMLAEIEGVSLDEVVERYHKGALTSVPAQVAKPQPKKAKAPGATKDEPVQVADDAADDAVTDDSAASDDAEDATPQSPAEEPVEPVDEQTAEPVSSDDAADAAGDDAVGEAADDAAQRAEDDNAAEGDPASGLGTVNDFFSANRD